MLCILWKSSYVINIDISFVISLNILFPCIYLGAQISPGILTKDILFPIDHINRNKVNTIVTVPTTITRGEHLKS